MHHQPLIIRWSMPITVVLLVIFSLAPLRWTMWTNWFSDQIRVAIAPVAHPITIAMNTIIPPPITNPEASQRERNLVGELDLVRTQLLQVRQENSRLTDLIDQLSRGAQITPDLDVKQLHRSSISVIGDQIMIKTNADDEISQGTVAVADAVQLLGKVSRVSGRTTTVLLITAKSSQPLLATILLDDAGEQQVNCLLKPLGDGTLRGEVARGTIDESWEVRIGQEVRLLDNQWPRHAQMLMIGTIERIEPDHAQPLRQQIIVRPTIKDLRRVPEVIFRLPSSSSDDADSSGGQP